MDPRTSISETPDIEKDDRDAQQQGKFVIHIQYRI